jgi:CO/xanthine dehydrogenase Mo-binding subunit
MGQGALTALAQIAADEATLPIDRVVVSTPDTAHTPWDQMTAASRTTNSMGRAIRAAVQDVKRQLIALAAERLEIAPEDLEIADGAVRPRGSPDRAIPFGTLIATARVGNILGHGTYLATAGLDPETGLGVGSPQWHPAVCAAEVEADPETGKIEITKLHLALYVGRMINPLACELQVEGAALFGVGQALFEEMVWDASGVLLNPNLSDYVIPSFLDAPTEFEETILETPGTLNVHGLGETALPTVAPAVGNAVARALGVRITELPLTPERVLRALAARRAAEEAQP